jgi:hypothetical protein
MSTEKIQNQTAVQCMKASDWAVRAPSRRLVLEDDYQGVVNQRDDLANAIGDAVVKAGIAGAGIPLTGHQLTFLLSNLVDHYVQLNPIRTTQAAE